MMLPSNIMEMKPLFWTLSRQLLQQKNAGFALFHVFVCEWVVKLGWSQRDSDTGVERANSHAERYKPLLAHLEPNHLENKPAKVCLSLASISLNFWNHLMSPSIFRKWGSNRQGHRASSPITVNVSGWKMNNHMDAILPFCLLLW